MRWPPKRSKNISKGEESDLKPSFRIKSILILFAGAFFALAPLWALHFQQVGGHTLFGTPDSLVILGVTLLVALLAAYVLPDFLVARSRPGVSRSPFSILRLLAAVCGLSSLILLVWVLYLINQHILHSFLSSADEHSCYFLAECLRRGRLFVDIPPMADFFKVVHVGMRDGKWFSVYPPGWPLLWAAGLQFHIVDWLNPMISSLAVFFFYLTGARLFGRVAAVLGLIILCSNPFFMFTSASYFSHATCLLCISVFLYAFLRFREAYRAGKDPVGWAFLSAFVVGYGLMTRYLTMAAVAVPFMLYHFLPVFFHWKGWRKGTIPFAFKRPQLRKSDWLVIGIVTAFMIMILYQNYLVTGKPFRAPNKYDKSWERLGFRRDYTPADGFLYLIARFFYLAEWFPPALIALYLVSLCFGFRGMDPGAKQQVSEVDPIGGSFSQLFRWAFFFIAMAYFFYYSWGGNQWGPRYYYEAIPFLCLAVADHVVRQWREGSLARRKFLLGVLITAAISGGFIFIKQADFVEESSRQRKALYELAERTIKKPAIVFIHGFLGSRLIFAEEDAIRNSPFLDGRILYAHDLGDRNKELMAADPGRQYYRGTYDQDLKRPNLERLS